MKNRSARVLAPALLLAACTGCAPEASLPDDGFVVVRGGRVAYRVLGAGPGIPALVIHGGPGSSSCLYPATLTRLAETRPVVIYDQLGSGYSSRIPPEDLPAFTDLDRFVEEIEALRSELRLDELHLVGHSWGAAVAMEYLLRGRTEGVRSVSFVGPLLSTEDWLEDARSLVATLSEASQDAIAASVETDNYSSNEFERANAEFESEYFRRTSPEDVDLRECNIRPPGNSGLYNYMWGPSEFLSTGTLREYDRTSELPALTIPTLFLVGEFDEATPERMSAYQRLVPGSELEVILGAAHLSNVDQPELFNGALIRFFESVEAR